LNDLLAELVKLQILDQSLEENRKALARFGPAREELAARRKTVDSDLEGAKKTLVDAHLKKKNLELEIDGKDQVIRKASGELNGVKSNDLYKSLLGQIDQAKSEKTALEDQVLGLMEEIESGQKKLKELEGWCQAERARLEERGADVNRQEAEVRADGEKQRTERAAFAAALLPGALRRYEEIQRGRPGFMALAPIQGMICGGCRTTLTANTVNQVMRAKELILCESCSRILYIPPKPAPAAAP
jgi:predicted  nucleic acid-binding Zn-ribbon protein